MALQLISLHKTSIEEPNDATTIKFHEDNLQKVLEQVDGRPVCTIAITGPSRQGKSFLLGHMIRCLDGLEKDVDDWMDWENQNKPLEEGFAWGNDPEHVTKGIWIWNKAYILKRDDVEFAVILIDTQGLYDEFTSNRDMTDIAGLGLMMSSLMIFNTFTNIQEDILDSLATFVEYGKMALELFNPIKTNPFQKLNFLIRDWNNPAQHNYGKAGGKGYIEKKLEIKSNQPASIQTNRRIITQSFSNIECYLMPGIGERALAADFDGSVAAMSIGFSEKLEQFISSIFFKALPLKIVAGNVITGQDFFNYVKTCVEIFGRGSIPVQKGLKLYTDTFRSSFGDKLYLHNSLLAEIHESSQSKALNFVKILKTSEDKEECRAQLLAKINLKFAKSRLENQKNRAQVLENAEQNADNRFQELFYNAIVDRREHFLEKRLIDKLANEATTQVVKAYTKQICEEDENDVTKMVAGLQEKLESTIQSVKIKNEKKKLEAEQEIEKICTQIVQNFIQKVNDTVNEGDFADNEFNAFLNDEEQRSMECFDSMEKPGEAAFHERFYLKLKEAIESEKGEGKLKYDSKLNDMTSTAEYILKDVATAYSHKIYLEMNKECLLDLEEFHELESRAIQTEFLTRNPFNAESLHTRRLCDKLSKEITKIYRQANTKAKAEMNITQTVTGYNKAIIQLLKTASIETMESLTSHHQVKKHEFITAFERKYAALEDNDRQNFVEKLTAEINDAFEVHQANLSTSTQGRELVFQKGLSDALKYYQNEMQHHMQTNHALDNDELYKIHLKTCQMFFQNYNSTLSAPELTNLRTELDTKFMQYRDKNTMKYNSMSDVAIGIDLGTTNCCVAVYMNGEDRIIQNSMGKDVTPSYVLLNTDGTETVGDPAKNNAFKNPENTIFNAKRIIGRRMADENLQDDLKYWPFTVKDVEGIPKIIAHNKEYHPEHISAKLLKKLRVDAESFLRHPVKKAVITVPAYFKDGQRQATIDAAEMAGLTVLEILNEPTAAAIAYKIKRIDDQPKTVLIFDLGGGTFDVAVLKINGGEIDVLAVDGDSHLGGEDFDKAMMEYCVGEFQTVRNIDLLEGKDSAQKIVRDNARRRLMRLQLYCESRKQELAVAESTDIVVDEIVPGIDLSVKMSRCIFEQLIEEHFTKVMSIVENALKSANIAKDDIEDIVMVGGSTRIVKVQQLLKDFFKGKSMNISINPVEAVAYGAAVRAAICNGKDLAEAMKAFTSIQDVTSMSYGTEENDGEFSIIIPKGSKIPATFTETYETTDDEQSEMRFGLYQGEDPIADKNELIGDFTVIGIPLKPAGQERVVLEMHINNMGILSVKATTTSTGKSKALTVESRTGRLTQEEKQDLKAEEEANIEHTTAEQAGSTNTNVSNSTRSSEDTESEDEDDSNPANAKKECIIQ